MSGSALEQSCWRRRETAWLYFFFKWNGLGNEPREGGVVCLLLLKFTRAQKPSLELLSHLDPGSSLLNPPPPPPPRFEDERCSLNKVREIVARLLRDDSSEKIVRADVPSLSRWADIVLMVSREKKKAARAINPSTAQATANQQDRVVAANVRLLLSLFEGNWTCGRCTHFN